jgi:hypothetical protein
LRWDGDEVERRRFSRDSSSGTSRKKKWSMFLGSQVVVLIGFN